MTDSRDRKTRWIVAAIVLVALVAVLLFARNNNDSAAPTREVVAVSTIPASVPEPVEQDADNGDAAVTDSNAPARYPNATATQPTATPISPPSSLRVGRPTTAPTEATVEPITTTPQSPTTLRRPPSTTAPRPTAPATTTPPPTAPPTTARTTPPTPTTAASTATLLSGTVTIQKLTDPSGAKFCRFSWQVSANGAVRTRTFDSPLYDATSDVNGTRSFNTDPEFGPFGNNAYLKIAWAGAGIANWTGPVPDPSCTYSAKF